MANFNSNKAIQRNAESWSQNITINTMRRRDIPMISELTNFTRLPRKKDIIGRYHTLLEKATSAKERIVVISEELHNLWKTFSFPILTKQSIVAKVSKLVEENVKHRKRNNNEFAMELENVFDITKTNGQWLCKEDKQLYNLQVKSQGTIGYVSSKLVPQSAIHPSKRERKSAKQCVPYTTEGNDSDSTSSETISSERQSIKSSNENFEKKQCYNSTSHAIPLVTTKSLSTNKATEVCYSLADSGIIVPTPSQSGVWRAVIRCGKHAKNQIKSILTNEKDFCLHFDGKRMDKHEYQVVILKSSLRELKLGTLKCKSGSSLDIFHALESLITEFDAWKNIKMIVCDTTPVNTGRLNGVVRKLKNEFAKRGFEQPQYVGCQHHILDRILKHVLDFFIPTPSTKPNLNYEFVDEVINHYDVLQQCYKPQTAMVTSENPGWRDDFRFLYELCTAFRYFKNTGAHPEIKWRKLPSLHNARWNSRATYALVSYFLIPKWRKSLEIPCVFISTTWQEAWFLNQNFNADTYRKLFNGISDLQCPTAMKCFVTQWNEEISVVDTPRTNICAERGIKLMEQLYQTCKTDKYLNLKFIATNTFDSSSE